jgi:N,N'-diacetyllegionaminate synthase
MTRPAKPYIIAEAGSCHEEILEYALDLVSIAAEAGASACKFQFWSSHERMRARRNVSDLTAFVRGSIHETWFAPLREATHARGLEFMCTAYLPEDVPLVAAYVDHFKIASFEHLNKPLLQAVLRAAKGTERRIFHATGLSQGTEASWYPRIPMGGHPAPVIRLHCVTSYPCPPEQANLAAIPRGGGWSDHTGIHFTGGLAVAAGADYLEVHVRREQTTTACPDYPHSLTPEQLKQYVSFAQVAFQMRGTGDRQHPQPAELVNLRHRVGTLIE